MDVHLAIADAYRAWASGDHDDVAKKCREILRRDAEHPGALHLLGLLAEAGGDHARALDCLERACAGDDAPSFIFNDLVDFHRRRGRRKEAVDAAWRAVQCHAADAEAWHRHGIALSEAGRRDESLHSLERAVALDAGSINYRNSLAIVLHQLGDWERACSEYAKALAGAPDNAAIHANMAAALGELGRYEEALAHACRSSELDPNLVSPHVYAALLDLHLGRFGSALRRIDQALRLEPEAKDLLLIRARILAALDRVEEALSVCHRVTAAAPEDGDAQALLASLLGAADKAEEALAAFDRAAALLAAPAAAISDKGALLMQLGRRAEAMAAFDRALSLQPDLVPAHYNRADAKRYARDDPDIAAMEDLLARARKPSYADRVSLHYALAKAYLDCGETDRAAAHLAQGSRMKRASISYDADAHARRVQSIIEAFSRETFAHRLGDPSEVPVFVLGMPRSGTTLAEQILSSHPLIRGVGELAYFEPLTIAGEDGEPEDHYPAFVASLDSARLATWGRGYLEKVARLAGNAARIVNKRTSNFLYAGLIHLALPRARIIHCRRDPMDTCFSCYTKLFSTGQEFTYDLGELGRYYRGYQQVMAHWRRVLPSDLFLEVQYEELVRDLEGVARRMIACGGWAWDQACLRFYETKTLVETASMNQVRQPIFTTAIGRWKDFERHLGPLIEALSSEG